MSNYPFFGENMDKFVQAVCEPFVGREEEAKVVALSLLCKEHCVLLGGVGTAKSALIQRASRLLNANYFYYLMTRFTEPSELFGTLDIIGLKKGVYRRITAGKLPEAHIAFLDEIFKASSAILNALLAILQERIYVNGKDVVQVPLWSYFGASNEIPEERELEALYDRLLFRHQVKPISEGEWMGLFDASWNWEFENINVQKPLMGLTDLENLHLRLKLVDVKPIYNKLAKVYALIGEKIPISDRRKGKALKAIASHAILEGRMTAQEEDLVVLKYIIPQRFEDFGFVEGVLTDELKTTLKYETWLRELDGQIKALTPKVMSVNVSDAEEVKEITEAIRAIRTTLRQITSECTVSSITKEAIKISENLQSISDKFAKKLGL